MSPVALLTVALGSGLPAAPPAPAPMSNVVVVDSVDVLPVAVAAVARADGRPGPCGPRALLALARADVDAFLAGRPVATSPMPDDAWPTDDVGGAPGGMVLPLWPGPGLFAGEDRILGLAVDAALAKAKLTTTAPTRLLWRGRQPFLRIASPAPIADVTTALRAGVARLRLAMTRRPGARALEQIDARLCLGRRADETTTTLTPATVRTALSAPLQPG
jgi:hypothetical protein